MPTHALTRGPGVIAVVGLLVLIPACNDAAGPQLVDAPQPQFAEVAGAVCHGYVEPGCTVTFTATPANYTCARDCWGLPPQTGTVTVVFSRPVYHLTVTGGGAYDCSGTFGEVTAYDPAGQEVEHAPLQLVDVSNCQVANWAGIARVTLQYPGAIARITISPMTPLEWQYCMPGGDPNPVPGGDPNPAPVCYDLRALAGYGYDFQEQPPCPATGDSLLDSPDVRAGLLDALKASHPDLPPGSRVEVGGLIWRRPDGTFFTSVVPPGPTTTECHFDGNYAEGVLHPPEPGAQAVGKFHTHPSQAKDPVYGCKSQPGIRFAQFPGDRGLVPTARPDENGGGSDADWESGTSDAFSLYVINAAGRVYRLDPDVPPDRRTENPNRWEQTEVGAVCLRRVP